MNAALLNTTDSWRFRPPQEEYDQLLYQSELMMIGQFRCGADHPSFTDTGPIQNHVVVFPRRPVGVVLSSKQSFVGDANRIVLHNRGQEFRRRPLTGQGDLCIWLAFTQSLLQDGLIRRGLAHRQLERLPFSRHFVACDNRQFLRLYQLLGRLLHGQPEPLWVEEQSIEVLNQALDKLKQSGAGCGYKHRQRSSTEQKHRQLALSAQELIASDPCGGQSLSEIAAELHTSPFHLARIFRRHCRCSLHQYRSQLQLRAVLEALCDEPRCKLSDLALDLGYSTPSHLCHAARRAFGRPLGEFRRLLQADSKVKLTDKTI